MFSVARYVYLSVNIVPVVAARRSFTPTTALMRPRLHAAATASICSPEISTEFLNSSLSKPHVTELSGSVSYQFGKNGRKEWQESLWEADKLRTVRCRPVNQVAGDLGRTVKINERGLRLNSGQSNLPKSEATAGFQSYMFPIGKIMTMIMLAA
jgi:hypothetical protein